MPPFVGAAFQTCNMQERTCKLAVYHAFLLLWVRVQCACTKALSHESVCCCCFWTSKRLSIDWLDLCYAIVPLPMLSSLVCSGRCSSLLQRFRPSESVLAGARLWRQLVPVSGPVACSRRLWNTHGSMFLYKKSLFGLLWAHALATAWQT